MTETIPNRSRNRARSLPDRPIAAGDGEPPSVQAADEAGLEWSAYDPKKKDS